jgi:hypothetical protein
MVMLAKGNRSASVREACAQYGGFYLGSIGGVAAKLALESIKKVEVLEYPELGMEAVHRIEVEHFPAFIVMDDKGNDFFANPGKQTFAPCTDFCDPRFNAAVVPQQNEAPTGAKPTIVPVEGPTSKPLHREPALKAVLEGDCMDCTAEECKGCVKYPIN